MTAPKRLARYSEEIAHLAAEYIERESDSRSLITVTHSVVSPDLKYVTIYCSVFPEDKREQAIGFIERKSKDFLGYLAKRGKFGRLPHVKFTFDEGEKRRQHLDEIYRKMADGGSE